MWRVTLGKGGTKEYKVLMDEFHHVSNAFLELAKGYILSLKNNLFKLRIKMLWPLWVSFALTRLDNSHQ